MTKFDAAKALEHTVVLLAGDEGTLRKKALDEMIRLAAGDDDFDIETFTGDVATPMAWFMSAGTAPFLSPRRVAVVRNVLRCDDPEIPENLQLPSTALVILVADEEARSEEKEKKADGALRRWEAAVKKLKGHITVFKVDPKELIETLRADAKALGKTLSPVAAERLAEMTGGSLSRASDELSKLVVFVGANTAITENDIEDVVVPSREWNIFKLIDGVVKGDAGGALRQLRILTGSNIKAESVAFSTIFPMLSRQLKLILQARAVLDAGGSPENLSSKMTSHFPARPNLATEKDYPRKLAFQFARAMSITQVQRAIETVADADARMKGMLPGFNTGDTLERMVLELVELLRRRSAAA